MTKKITTKLFLKILPPTLSISSAFIPKMNMEMKKKLEPIQFKQKKIIHTIVLQLLFH